MLHRNVLDDKLGCLEKLVALLAPVLARLLLLDQRRTYPLRFPIRNQRLSRFSASTHSSMSRPP